MVLKDPSLFLLLLPPPNSTGLQPRFSAGEGHSGVMHCLYSLLAEEHETIWILDIDSSGQPGRFYSFIIMKFSDHIICVF